MKSQITPEFLSQTNKQTNKHIHVFVCCFSFLKDVVSYYEMTYIGIVKTTHGTRRNYKSGKGMCHLNATAGITEMKSYM
jgi:hypothetical protein